MKSLEELKEIREKAKKRINIRSGGEVEEVRILVGMGTCGISSGARETLNSILDEVNERDLKGVYVTQVGCDGNCHAEPIVQVKIPQQEPVLYGKVTPAKGKEIIEKHIIKGEVLQDLIIGRAFHE